MACTNQNNLNNFTEIALPNAQDKIKKDNPKVNSNYK